MVIDVNQYKILIIIRNSFKLILDKNFMKLLGFSKHVINPGYNRSDLIPQIDKTKYLKIYCNIVNNKNENEFLRNVFIKNGIGDLVENDNFNIYKKQKILDSNFNLIEICVRNQYIYRIKGFLANKCLYRLKYMDELDKLFDDIEFQLNEESKKYRKLKICKYSFEISKVCILSLATGLSFLNIFAILSMILIPIIDSIKHNSNVDNRLFQTKLKKDLLKELLNYKSSTYKELTEDEILHLYSKITNKLSVINTF